MIVLKILVIWTAASIVGGLLMAQVFSRLLNETEFRSEDEWS